MTQEIQLFSQVFQAIRRADRILLVSDGRPDGDSIGSTGAMLNWLLREGKTVTAFCRERLPRSLLYLAGAGRFTRDPAVFDRSYDLIMTFDASDLRHCGIEDLLPRVPAGYALVMFDHHATNEKFGHVNVLMTDACSTCEVVYRFLDACRVPIDPAMATCLLSGIFTDTSSFSNAGTTVAGMKAAGRLVAAGAYQPDILRNLVKNKSVDSLKLWGLALARLRHHPEFNLVSTYFLLEDLTAPGSDEAVDGMSDFLNAVCGGCETVLVLRELPDGKVKGSLRSITRDISRVAKLLGGGGHRKAAGFTVRGKLKIENGKARIEGS